MKKISELEALCQVTANHRCGYLSDQKARIQFIPLSAVTDEGQFSFLNEHGYRRSGNYIYRPVCQACSSCIPLRVLSKQFTPSHSQQRCWKKNQDLSVCCTKPYLNEERYQLYEKYINTRHRGGEMFPPSAEQFVDFLCESPQWCNFYEFRNKKGELLAITAVDHLYKGIAPIYTFFDAGSTSIKRSLGTFCILWLINYAKCNDIPYVYLGYWIKQCKKMVYKIKFKPCELLIQGQWCLSSQTSICDN